MIECRFSAAARPSGHQKRCARHWLVLRGEKERRRCRVDEAGAGDCLEAMGLPGAWRVGRRRTFGSSVCSRLIFQQHRADIPLHACCLRRDAERRRSRAARRAVLNRLEAAHRISSQIDALLGGWLGRGECVRTGWSFAPRQNSGRAAAAARCLYERAKRVVA
jgi:hypothetical protein